CEFRIRTGNNPPGGRPEEGEGIEQRRSACRSPWLSPTSFLQHLFGTHFGALRPLPPLGPDQGGLRPLTGTPALREQLRLYGETKRPVEGAPGWFDGLRIRRRHVSPTYGKGSERLRKLHGSVGHQEIPLVAAARDQALGGYG